MADGLARILAKPGFDADNFVSKLSQGGEDDLTEMRQKVGVLSEETSVALKKNVYKNYSQFIETAKEISILEGEMYQLSHMLTEQKSIMNTMMELSISGDRGPVEGPQDEQQPTEEDTRQNLAFLLEKVEGCSSITEVEGRYLVHDGDLVELEAESFSQVQKVHAFLLNDSLMIASWLPYRRGPVKYRFHSLYELDSLAVVNARDIGTVKNAFKILMFPDTRMYQTDNPKAKRQWLDILEETKKKKAALDNQRKEAAIQAQAHAEAQQRASTLSLDSGNPFGEDFEAETSNRDSLPQTPTVAMETEFLQADWLMEVPEDLDVCIAQRDFEGAVDLIEKVNEFLKGYPKSAMIKEYRSRIEHRVKSLTEVLVHELQLSPERSLRGGPRAARRAVTQLIRLGKSAEACNLFLKNRSSIIKYNLRQLKIEGATTLYARRLCQAFFSNMMETGREFLKAFPDHYGCFSAFVFWAKEELQSFITLFSQIFKSKSNLSTIAECVDISRKHCDQLNDIGLELTFAFNALLAPELVKVITDSKEQIIEAVKLRAGEDLWRPTNQQNKDQMNKFLEEMISLGVDDMEKYIFDDCWLITTPNTAQFTRLYLNFLQDLLKIYTQELHYEITEALYEVFKAQLKHLEKSMQADRYKREQKCIVGNGAFLIDTLLRVVQKKFEEVTGQQSKRLHKLQGSMTRIKGMLVRSPHKQEHAAEFV